MDEAQAQHVPESAGPLYKVAYDEAVRGLTSQSGVLDNLRTRAGVLVTASNVVTAFLAPQAITNGSGLHLGAFVAVGLFLACVGVAIRLLMSRRNWRFTVDSVDVIRRIEGEKQPNAGDLYKWLAAAGDAAWKNNQTTIDSMFSEFRLGCVLLVLEVVAWIGVLGKVNVAGVQW